MRNLIIILTCIATFQLFAEKEIELTPIVLPYDSLNIDEVYGYGATIIARSGNTIYHSTDDGGSWDIALESDTKLNQLYSKDPHTVFAIGDSGLVYRTYDYGASWFDVSVDTDLELREMVAGENSEYMIITPRTYSFRKSGQDSEYDYLENRSNVTLDNIEYHDRKYYYSGGANYGGYRVYGISYTTIYLPLFINDNGKSFEIELDYGEVMSQYNTSTNNLRPYSIGDSLLFSFNNHFRGKKSSVLTNHPNTIVTFGLEGVPGIEIPNDTFIYVKEKDSIVTYITERAKLAKTYLQELDKFQNPVPYEKYDLGIEVVNNVFKIQEDDYLIASNNSTIYRTKLVNIPTSVEQQTNNEIEFYNDIIEFKDKAKLLYITNYMGQKSHVQKVGASTYRLDKGLNFIIYIDKKGIFRTIKVMVNK